MSARLIAIRTWKRFSTELDRELVGLKPVKSYIRQLASLLLVIALARAGWLATEHPTLHM